MSLPENQDDVGRGGGGDGSVHVPFYKSQMTLICTLDRDGRSKKTMRKHHTHKNLNEMSEALIQLDVKGITGRINNGWVCMGRQGFEKNGSQ